MYILVRRHYFAEFRDTHSNDVVPNTLHFSRRVFIDTHPSIGRPGDARFAHDGINNYICFLDLKERVQLSVIKIERLNCVPLTILTYRTLTVLGPPFLLRPSDSWCASSNLPTLSNVASLKLNPSPASALCSSKYVTKNNSSSAVQWAWPFRQAQEGSWWHHPSCFVSCKRSAGWRQGNWGDDVWCAWLTWGHWHYLITCLGQKIFALSSNIFVAVHGLTNNNFPKWWNALILSWGIYIICKLCSVRKRECFSSAHNSNNQGNLQPHDGPHHTKRSEAKGTDETI